MQSAPVVRPPVSGRDTPGGAAAGARRPLFGGLFGLFESKPSTQAAADPNADPLSAFPSEAGSRSQPGQSAGAPGQPPSQPGNAPRSRFPRPLLIVVGVLVLAGLAGFAIRRFLPAQLGSAAPRFGNLTIDTRPVTSEVLVDGERRGVTPLTLSLPPGAHTHDGPNPGATSGSCRSRLRPGPTSRSIST